MQLRCCLVIAAVLSVLLPQAVAAQTAVVPVRLTLDTTCEWVRLDFRGLQLRPIGKSLEVLGPADLAVPLVQGNSVTVRKPPYDASRVRLTLDFAGVLTGDAVQVLLQRASAGTLRVELTSAGQSLGSFAGPAPPRGPAILSVNWQQFRTNLPRRDWGRRMLAFYYGWWGTPTGPAKAWKHWDPADKRGAVNSPPLLGPYDSADPAVIRQHVQWAQQAGIDTLVLSLWQTGVHQDQVLAQLLPIAAQAGLTVSGYLEVATGPEDLRRQLLALLRGPMAHPAWLTVHGQKVVFLYTRVIQAHDHFGMQRALGGLPVLAIGDTMDTSWLDTLGGLHNYVSFIAPALTYESLRQARNLSRLHDKPAVATVMPAYDDTAIRFPGRHIPREGGRYLADQFRDAALADWVILTSFNELHEGSEIEPTLPDKEVWLQRTRQWVDWFKGGLR